MNVIRTLIHACAVTAICGLSIPALAQDGGLYEDVPDPNASFVRIVAVGLNNAVVNTTAFDQLPSGISGYVVIDQPGEIAISAGVDETMVTVEAGKYYSFVVGLDGTKTLLSEDVTLTPAQSVVNFFNLSDMPTVDLFVPQAKAVAVPAVAMNGAGSVALRAPITLDFEVRDGETVLATLPAVELKRRSGTAIVFTGTDGNYQVVVEASTLAR
jgi:hypothetical protein